MARRWLAGAFLALCLGLPGLARAGGTCGWQEMAPADLAADLRDAPEQGAYLLLDMRPGALFLAGTIPGAINTGQLDRILADDTHRDVDARPIVILTEDGQVDSALQAWIARACAGGVEVWILQGGLRAWRARGLPLEDPSRRLTAPGAVPFVIPRGLCELNDPAQEYQ